MSITLAKKYLTLIPACACILLSTGFQSCNKEDPDVLPQIVTSPVDMIARTAARASGTIIDEGSDSIMDKGFCWSTETEPDLSDQFTNRVFSDEEHMEDRMEGLSPGTSYYVRAYATSSAGTVYGNEESFTTKPADAMTLFNPDLSYDSVQDIDGNIYKTIVIGEQEWMAENLKTTMLSDGTAIPFLTLVAKEDLPDSPAYSWYENNESVFKDIYGAYYNGFAVSTSRLCPSGWHVPSDEEWKILEMHLAMTEEEADAIGYRGSTEGAQLKESGTYNWVVESEPGSNRSGFTALPGGNGSWYGGYGGEAYVGLWWTSTPLDPGNYSAWLWIRWVMWDASWISRSEYQTRGFCNVRCIRDQD